MKASEFRKILKPLVLQTVKEVLLQEGVLSNIVAEVAKGLGNPIVEHKHRDEEIKFKEEKLEKQRQERIKKLNESSKFGNIFSGTKDVAEANSQGPLANMPSEDCGVDITDIEKPSCKRRR